MAKELATFAGGGVVVHNQRWDPELSEDIIEYIETHSDFRKFVRTIPTQSYVINLPRKWHAGIAVEVVEGSEIPKARDVYDAISINLRQNGTGIRMTDEEQDMMGFDPNYFQTEAKRASERLLKKENDDIATVLLAGAAYNLIASSNTTLKFDDILLESLEEGVDGMRIEIIPEVGDNVYLIDTSQDPIVLVEKDGVKVESYRLNETREDVLDLTVYEKPAVLRPDAITKITITRNDTLPQRVFPAGWDPLNGYPAR